MIFLKIDSDLLSNGKTKKNDQLIRILAIPPFSILYGRSESQQMPSDRKIDTGYLSVKKSIFLNLPLCINSSDRSEWNYGIGKMSLR